jgi:hypothetical protein
MSLPNTLKFALKEWNVVCRALGSGRQIMLLRKGGISESIGGFELEHSQFLLFPTFLHQNLQMLKSEVHAQYEPHSAEPAKIVRLKNRQQMDALDAEHIWTSPLIDMRFNYRPANPLYLLLTRAYCLPRSVMIDNTPEYAGCKSWVPLEQAISVGGASAVLGETEYQRRRERILSLLQSD